MGDVNFKKIIDGLDVEIVVRNKDGEIVYKNVNDDKINNLDIVSGDIYIDKTSKKQYHKSTKEIDDYSVDMYYDITKFLDKKLSLDMTDENVIVKDENGNVVYNNLPNDMLVNMKEVDENIYFYSGTNRYFQKHVTISGRYQAEAYHDVTKFIEQASKYTIDGLTGLPVRAKVNEYISEISKKEAKYTIAMMDIDNFKKVNDTYGHLVGDEVLKRIASIIKRSTRGSDFAGRYGGEEFIMFFETDDIEAIIRRLNYIRALISYEYFYVKGFDDFNVTVSIGVSSFDPTQNDVYETIDQADQALYYVKQNGKNNVKNFTLINDKVNVK